MRRDTENWIATAEYDLETARHMLATGRYLYVVFCCHLALEKMLKAHVAEVTQSIPPKTHELTALVKKSGLQLPREHARIVARLNTASTPTRYPDDIGKLLNVYDEAAVRQYLKQTEEIILWLKQHPNLQT